ncbi:MAG TPA: hypothetical protein VE397_14640 [Stellaceae bacterium]|nr:hypothetical protein [Stellaceae bacterium]
MIVGKAWGAALVALVLVAASARAADQPGATQQALVKAFEERVFVALPGSTQKLVLKWQVPVSFGVVSREGISPRYYNDTFARIEEMQEASGKDFLVSSSHINFLVLFSTDTEADVKAFGAEIAPFFADGVDYHGFFEDYQRHGLGCAGKMLLSPEHAIIGYLLFVSVSEDRSLDAVDACVARDLLRGMGVIAAPAPGKAEAAPRRAGNFTQLDRQILQVLYNSALKSGEPASEAAKAILKIPVAN